MRGFRCAQAALVARSQQFNKMFQTSATQFLMTRSMSTASVWLRTSRPNCGVVTFKLADIGEGIAEVELLRWHIKEGDSIDEMDQVCEVQSDKSAVEISSRFTGKVIKFHHAVGDMIKIGQSLMDIDVQGAGENPTIDQDAHSKPPETTPTKETAREQTNVVSETTAKQEPKTKVTSAKDVLASPACRHLAHEYGINLADVPATGPGGRVTKEDVIIFKNSGGAVPSMAPSSTPSPSAKGSAPRSSGGDVKEEILLKSGVAKGMVKSMNASLNIPMMSIQEEVDITPLDKTAKMTITTLLVKAVSSALTNVPIMNSKFNVEKQDRYTMYHNHNISIAIDTPIGLLVPNIKNVENLSLVEIQKELGTLQEFAKNGKLGPTHLTGGTISISNVGVIGGTAVRPILFDGQATILGLGRVQKLPKYNEKTKTFEPRDFMNITATVDHRHVDGATVARFMKCLREIIEQPQLMML